MGFASGTPSEATVGDPQGPASATVWRVDDTPGIGALRDTIAVNLQGTRIEYFGNTGAIEAFWAGNSYHSVFARDMATIGPLARYFYSANHLRSPIEEFLALQETAGPDAGAIPGVFTPGGRADKATATSDEDVSVVHLAYLYFQHEGGRTWLSQQVRGQTILNRLNWSIDWLYRARGDAATGLIKRAHTTDWGDVKSEGGPNPTDLEPNDHVVASVYDQALLFRALLELAEMNEVVGFGQTAADLRGRAGRLRDQTNALMWQSQRGFYKPHIHLTPLVHHFDEDGILGAGNIEAVRSGLADVEQARLIFTNFERARIAARSPKAGLVAWPPYPEGAFPNMLPGEYQNGGIWDWWGGRQIEAEFEAGQSALAFSHLTALSNDWASRPGEVWEWQELWGGRPRGSHTYAGAAAVVGTAVVNGLFGIEMNRTSFRITPRLAGRSGAIIAQHPGTGRQIQLEAGGLADGQIALRYTAFHPGVGSLRYLLPAGYNPVAALIDGQPVPVMVESVGDDRYLLLPAPAASHTVQIQFG